MKRVACGNRRLFSFRKKYNGRVLESQEAMGRTIRRAVHPLEHYRGTKNKVTEQRPLRGVAPATGRSYPMGGRIVVDSEENKGEGDQPEVAL